MRSLILSFSVSILLTTAPLVRSEDHQVTLPIPHDGRVVLVDFWASWCGPCLRSFPWMNGLIDDLGAQGLTILAINLDSDRASADAFLRENPARFSVKFDPEGTYARQFDVDAMPSSFLVNRNGLVVHRHRGFRARDAEPYRALIQAELRRGREQDEGTLETRLEEKQ